MVGTRNQGRPSRLRRRTKLCFLRVALCATAHFFSSSTAVVAWLLLVPQRRDLRHRRRSAAAALVLALQNAGVNDGDNHPTQPLSAANTAPSISVSPALTDAGEDDEEEYQLRFGGVGRLYATPSSSSSSDAESDAALTILQKLRAATVVVVGLGGVGSWAAEALVRSGVGHLVLIDLDDICISNTNRQVHTNIDTIGQFKIDSMKDRLLQIHPHCDIQLIHDFVTADNARQLMEGILEESNNNEGGGGETLAVLDAMDGAKEKAALIATCRDLCIPIVTCGGAAGRHDPTKIVGHDDLVAVEYDKLLSTTRRYLRKWYQFPRGLSWKEQQRQRAKGKKFRVACVYSTEKRVDDKNVVSSDNNDVAHSNLRHCDGVYGTACFVTGTFGFVAASILTNGIVSGGLRPPIY